MARPKLGITGFSPDSGVPGDEVTISGENFSATASENTVEFNGVSATVTAASATSLTVVVPSGASTGKISVTVNGQTATSTDDFSVVFIKQVATGYFYTLMLKSDNTLWATGDNKHGKLGDGTDTNISTPKKIMEDVKSMAGWSVYTLILKEDNTLWATGYNGQGQLGDGTTHDISFPKQIIDHVRAVVTGYSHTVVLKLDNTTWVWGSNHYGQFDGTAISIKQPKLIDYAPKQIATARRGDPSLKSYS